jgi:hypothetical protein
MATECRQDSFDFGTVEGRAVVGAFDGGVISSDGGALLLGATDEAIGLVDRFAACFRDGRAAERIEHSIETLVRQRVVGIVLGYEDLLDHDELRHDPVMAVLAGKLKAQRKDCAPVAGKSTLSRLEHAPAEGEAFALARGQDPLARRLGLRARGADGVVRGDRRRLRVRAGPQQPAGGQHRA